jgi:hypothetical protein
MLPDLRQQHFDRGLPMEPDPRVLYLYEEQLRDLRRTVTALERVIANQRESLEVSDRTIGHYTTALAAAQDIIRDLKRIHDANDLRAVTVMEGHSFPARRASYGSVAALVVPNVGDSHERRTRRANAVVGQRSGSRGCSSLAIEVRSSRE